MASRGSSSLHLQDVPSRPWVRRYPGGPQHRRLILPAAAATRARPWSRTASGSTATACSTWHVHLPRGPRPVRRVLSKLVDLVWTGKTKVCKVFCSTTLLDLMLEACRAMDSARQSRRCCGRGHRGTAHDPMVEGRPAHGCRGG